MKKKKSILLQLFSLCIGGILFSCGSMSNGDETLIKKRMQNFLEEKINRSFILKDFDFKTNYQVNSNFYLGSFYAADDPRIVVYLSVYDDDNYTAISNPERVLTYYQRLNRSVAITDQVNNISNKYFTPDHVSTYVWTEAENFNIEIFKRENLTPKIIANYVTDIKKITQDIENEIQELDGHYYRVELNIFKDDYKLSNIQDNHMAADPNHPTGDYFIRAQMGSNNEIELTTRAGFGSKLDNKFKTEIANQYNMESGDVSRDFQANRDRYPEDLDKNDVRNYIRYFVAIFDNAGQEVIRRDFYKVNIFTHEITSYQPKDW